jgi:hypothetical protein
MSELGSELILGVRATLSRRGRLRQSGAKHNIINLRNQ